MNEMTSNIIDERNDFQMISNILTDFPTSLCLRERLSRLSEEGVLHHETHLATIPQREREGRVNEKERIR